MSVQRVAVAALLALSAGCRPTGTIAPTDLVGSHLDPSPQQAFMREVFETFEDDTCGVRRVLATRDEVFDPDTELRLAELGRLANELCDADVRRVATRLDVRGEPDIYGSEAGWLVGDRSVYFFGPVTERELDPIPLPASTAAAAPRRVTLNNLSILPVTLGSRDGARLCTAPLDGTCDPTEAVVVLAPDERVTLFVDSPSRELPLEVAEQPVESGVVVWSGGALELPVRVEGTIYEASQLDPYMYCSGYIAEQPTIRLRVSGRSYPSAEVHLRSPGVDPVLVIVGPSGEVHCNDDSYGLEPAIWLTFSPGDWEIYAGSYSHGDAFPATLQIMP